MSDGKPHGTYPAGQFSVRSEQRDFGSLIRLTGDLDRGTRLHFERSVDATIREAAKHIRIDLTEVTFMSSEGIWSIVDVARRCAGAGIRLDLTMTDRHRRLLEIVGVLDLFDGSTEPGPPPR